MADEGDANVRRLRLIGDRFAGGRLPVDSLVELEVYQELLRKLARFEWESEHVGEPLPPDFDDTVGLTILRIDDGSADVVLTLERPEAYASYVDKSADTLNATLKAAYDGGELPQLPEALSEDFRTYAATFGASLALSESIEVYPYPAADPIVVTRERREEATARLLLEDFWYTSLPEERRSHLRTEEATLVGRFTELDADGRKYTFKSLLYGTLHGRYSDPSLTTDIRVLLESSAVAPITRLVGDLQYQNGQPWRFRETALVERFGIENDRWGARLVEFAELPGGWGDEEDGSAISVVALEAAREIMLAVERAGAQEPALFPTTGGGVLVEWASPASVRSIEITEGAVFELFDLPAGSYDSTFNGTTNLAEAIEFAIGSLQGEPGDR